MEGEAYELQKEYHQRATGFLKQALECDESSSMQFLCESFVFRVEFLR